MYAQIYCQYGRMKKYFPVLKSSQSWFKMKNAIKFDFGVLRK